MSKRPRGLTAEEAKLWDRVAAGVKRRRASKKPAIDVAPPAEKPQVKPQRTRTVAPAPARPRLTPPADRGGEKRVRRGRVELDATLDLHGHTQASGRAALARHIASACARGARAIIIVTGSGRSGEGVLKRRLPEWLAEPDLRPLVTGFAQAHRKHGGGGAYYVFLKRSADE